jgi:hypothetical protein
MITSLDINGGFPYVPLPKGKPKGNDLDGYCLGSAILFLDACTASMKGFIIDSNPQPRSYQKRICMECLVMS